MTPLIPALINLLVSGIRKGGGGGRPEMSQQEKSDRYWTGRLMSGDLDTKPRKGDGNQQQPSRIKPWPEHMGRAQGK